MVFDVVKGVGWLFGGSIVLMMGWLNSNFWFVIIGINGVVVVVVRLLWKFGRFSV
jgi:hypothetical protein